MTISKLRIAFDELLREKKSGGNIFLEAIALLLIGVLIFFNALNDYNKNQAEEILIYGVKDTGAIVINGVTELSELELLIQELRDIPEIKKMGSYFEGNFFADDYEGDFFDDIYELQRNHIETFEDLYGKKCIGCVDITAGSEELFKISIDKGYDFGECKNLLDEYDELIYLGSRLDDNGSDNLSIGTVLEDKSGKKLLVAGVLKTGTRMIKENVTEAAIAYIEMDYEILKISRDEMNYMGNIIFTISNKANMSTVREKIDEMASKHHVNVTIKTYKGIFEGITDSKRALTDFLKKILAVILVTVVILQICMQSVHIIENFENYGILYANGFSTLDHYAFFMIQSLIKGIIAVFLTIGAGYFLVDMFYSDTLFSMKILYEVILKYVLWKIVICAVIIATFSAFICMIIFSGKAPKELMNGS